MDVNLIVACALRSSYRRMNWMLMLSNRLDTPALAAPSSKTRTRRGRSPARRTATGLRSQTSAEQVPS